MASTDLLAGLDFSSFLHDSRHLSLKTFDPPLVPVEAEDTQDPQEGEDRPADSADEMNVPEHPIPSMQDAFAESMQEAAEDAAPSRRKSNVNDAETRRKILLDQKTCEETHAARWRKKPGEKHHKLWKLMAQISFGIYLLLNGIAKDDEQVLAILRGHVDEVDEFLESTLADFDLSQKDIEERLKFLKLPLSNIEVFDKMLEDRKFRLQIVEGNERIEHIITRTTSAMNDALQDVEQGLAATREFAVYLAKEQESDRDYKLSDSRPNMQEIFQAMKGNADGWYKAYVSLQGKGNSLGESLVQLGNIVAEMDRRAGEVSRNTRFSITPSLLSSASADSPPSSPQQAIHSQSLHHSTSKSRQNSTASPVRPAPPALHFVPEREVTPEQTPDMSDEDDEEDEGDSFPMLLQPFTYSPQPSPGLAPTVYSTPEPSQRSSRSPPVLAPTVYSTPNTSQRSSRNQMSLRLQPNDRVSAGSMASSNSASVRMSEQSRRLSPQTPASGSAAVERPNSNASLHMQNSPRTADRLGPTTHSHGLFPRSSVRRSAAPERPTSNVSSQTSSRRPSGYQQVDLDRSTSNLEICFPLPPATRPVMQERPSSNTSSEVHYTLQPPPRAPSSLHSPIDSRKSSTTSFDNSARSSPPRLSHQPGPLNRYGSSASKDSYERPRRPPQPSFLQRPSTAGQPSPHDPASHSVSFCEVPSMRSSQPPLGLRTHFPSPASDQPYLRPLTPLAPNPNSPLQRPWTASGPAPPRPPMERLPSAKGTSIISQSTTATDKKIKKKKSGFGWLKKAFTLDPEEKAAFEARRRAAPMPADLLEPQPRFLDGRRIN